MADDFAYINARIRGMRGCLLTPEEREALVRAPDLDALSALLRDTAYGPSLDSALAREGGITGVEAGIRERLSAILCRLPLLADGAARALLDLVIGRWENQCVKALLRGKIKRFSPSYILSSCLPAGRLDEQALRELAGREGLEEIIDILVLWGFVPAKSLRRVLRRSRETEVLQLLEHSLDQVFFGDALEVLEAGVRGGEHLLPLLLLEIDLLNFLSLCRLVEAHSSPAVTASFFLRGGRSLPRDLYLRLAGNPDAGHLLDEFEGTRIGSIIGGALPRYRATGRLSVIEREAHRALLREAVRAARLDPLGPGLAAGFVWVLAEEATNLRLLCRARHAGLPPRDLAGELTFTVN